MNFVSHFNLFGVDAKQIPCIIGEGAPTTTTEGAVGCFYMDSTNGDIYKCTNVADGVYTWVCLKEVTVVHKTGESENKVMSQKAVSDEFDKMEKKISEEDLTLLCSVTTNGTHDFAQSISGLNCIKIVTGDGSKAGKIAIINRKGTSAPVNYLVEPNSVYYGCVNGDFSASWTAQGEDFTYDIYLVNNYEVTHGNLLKYAKDSLISENEDISVKFNQGSWYHNGTEWVLDTYSKRISTTKLYLTSGRLTVNVDAESGYSAGIQYFKGDTKVGDTGWFNAKKTVIVDNIDWITIVSRRQVDGVDVSISPYEDTGITVNASYIIRPKANKQDIIEMDERIKKVEGSSNANIFTFDNPFKRQKYYSHLFIDKIYESSNPIIPCQSLFDVAVASRLGFNIVEGNVQKTATEGKYIVMHGISGTIGGQLTTLDGSSANDVVIANTTFDDLRNNYKYRSQYEKYQTKVSSLEEFLNECKKFGITPFIQYRDTTQLEIVKQICGNNFILYGGNRAVFEGMIYQWNTTATTKEEIFSICENVGAPFMFAMAYPDNFTDEELTEIINGVHERNCLIGFAGCYNNPIINKKLLELGFDFSASSWEVDDFESGNLVNAYADIDFADFNTTGSVENGVLALNEGDTVTVSNLSQEFLAKGSLHITFNGTITLNLGSYIHHDFTSDGTADSWFSTYFMNQTPNFTITAKTATTISTINYKASKC